jgi:protein-S-isoprenylcysteine O-methyltransferase Ste14
MLPLLRTLIFTLLVPGTVMVLLPLWLVGPGASVNWRGWNAVGLIPMAVGGAVYLRCAWDFSTFGRGTPGPWDPPQKLVARGLYRYVRNPMYLGVGLVGLGEAALFNSPAIFWYVITFWGCTHLFIVFYEEPALRHKFGADYDDYCRRVPRWLPRLRPTGGSDNPRHAG